MHFLGRDLRMRLREGENCERIDGSLKEVMFPKDAGAFVVRLSFAMGLMTQMAAFRRTS
jgi:hypothetical protein